MCARPPRRAAQTDHAHPRTRGPHRTPGSPWRGPPLRCRAGRWRPVNRRFALKAPTYFDVREFTAKTPRSPRVQQAAHSLAFLASWRFRGGTATGLRASLIRHTKSIHIERGSLWWAVMPTVVANGIELYYERRGSGPRLLFFNGSGATLTTSAPLIWSFADRFDVVAHDQRGLGRTEIPPGPYAMADYARDAAALLDHLGWATCRVIGVSFGGMVAQEFAVTWPQRGERLALLCTSPGGVGGASYPLHELAVLPPDERAAVGLRILDTRFTPEWLAAHASDRALVEMMAARTTVPKAAQEAPGQTEHTARRA